MFFPFNLTAFGVNGDMFGWGMSLVLMLEASTLFVICVNYLSLLCSYFEHLFQLSLGQKRGLTIC